MNTTRHSIWRPFLPILSLTSLEPQQMQPLLTATAAIGRIVLLPLPVTAPLFFCNRRSVRPLLLPLQLFSCLPSSAITYSIRYILSRSSWPSCCYRGCSFFCVSWSAFFCRTSHRRQDSPLVFLFGFHGGCGGVALLSAVDTKAVSATLSPAFCCFSPRSPSPAAATSFLVAV